MDTVEDSRHYDIVEIAMGPDRRSVRLRPEVLVVASTGLATFVAGAAGLLQSNLPVAVPTLAVAALLGSWALHRQLRMPMSASGEVAVSNVPRAADIITGREPERANARAVPRQLPAAVSLFAGRRGELARLTNLLRDQTDRTEVGATVVISAIGGTAGVGKTALAVYWAHQAAEEFPGEMLETCGWVGRGVPSR